MFDVWVLQDDVRAFPLVPRTMKQAMLALHGTANAVQPGVAV